MPHLPTALPCVVITISRHWGDCEDCGSFSYASGGIELPGRTLDIGYDGHLGGGNWDGDTETACYWALTALGYVLHDQGIAQEDQAFFVNTYDKGYRDQVLVPLFTGERTPVDLAAVTLELPELAKETPFQAALMHVCTLTLEDSPEEDEAWGEPDEEG